MAKKCVAICRRNIKTVFSDLKKIESIRNFDFDRPIRKKNRTVQLFGNKVIEKFSLTSHTELKITSPMYLFSI